MQKIDPAIFKAYDIRGLLDSQLTVEVAYYLGLAYAQIINPEPKIIGVGRDVRTSGAVLFRALVKGLTDSGFEVVDLGVISTDMLYFAVGKYGYGGGIVVSASHNPREYNGFKLVREGAKAISGDTGIMQIRDKVIELQESNYPIPESFELNDIHTRETLVEDYLEHVTSFVNLKNLKKFRIAFNVNHGASGNIMQRAIEKFNLPVDAVWLYKEPNGDFPQGRPDPLQEANQIAFSEFIKKHKVDFGVAWDADADRCFFFDENGEFIDGYFTTALLAELILQENQGEKIIYDPRQTWAVIDTVAENGGTSLVNKVGHSFIKNRMRQENAIFAGENSGHYYFRENYFADNGMIPVFMFWELISRKGIKVSQLLHALKTKYFISGEINLKVENASEIMEKIEQEYSSGKVEKIDGLSVEFADWRFNLRSSNTEPLLRLNLEAKSRKVMEERRGEVLKLIK